MSRFSLNDEWNKASKGKFGTPSASPSVNSLSYVPQDLSSSVSGQDDLIGNITGQGTRLNGMSSNYGSTASSINAIAIPNLLKYGEVSENDLVGQATTDNTLAYDKAWDAAQRNLTRLGINPNSGRFAGAAQDYALNRAAAEAGARNLARIQARQENFKRAQALAGFGRGYDQMALNAAGNALQAYNAAANNQDAFIRSTASLYNYQNQAIKDRANEARMQSIADLGGGSFAKGMQMIYNGGK